MGRQPSKTTADSSFDVFIIPDEMRVFTSAAVSGDLGVLGVSCALTNWGGGGETNTLSIPVQGLLLDYMGCSYHWDDEDFPIDTNLKKLGEILASKAHQEAI